MDDSLPERIKVLKNGALYDNDIKRIVGVRPELAEVNTQITPESSKGLQARRQELKRAAVMTTANGHKSSAKFHNLGELAFMGAITESMMDKATNPKDSKAVDAARWLESGAGLGADHDNERGESAVSEVRELVRSLADMARAVSQLHATKTGESAGQ